MNKKQKVWISLGTSLQRFIEPTRAIVKIYCNDDSNGIESANCGVADCYYFLSLEKKKEQIAASNYKLQTILKILTGINEVMMP